jgi:oxalate decarboxylase/phosphoglucose isomerase-like protein (cupin superfamily)
MTTFRQVVLYTDAGGRARFREEDVPLDQGSETVRLSRLLPASGLQLRRSPPGFRSDFHCTEVPQWVFVLQGRMEIGLQDGSVRVFGPGEHFFSADTLPAGVAFDPRVHGHRSRQVGDEPLVTAFVKAGDEGR